MLPYLTVHAPWFAFLVHPRDTWDLRFAGVGSILRQYSSSEEEFELKTSSLPPLVVGEIRIGFGPVRGEVVAAMSLPQRIMRKEGLQGLIAAAQLATKRGAKVLGLGGLTSPATGAGSLLLHHIPSGVTLTNGNAYTAAVIRRNVLEARSVLSRLHAYRVAVVGCTGSVGRAACQLLAEDGLDLLLIGRNAERASALLRSVVRHAVFSGDVSAVRHANIIVLLTNDTAAKLSPELVSPGTIVIDVCQPPNIAPETYEMFLSRGIEVVEGGIVEIPGYTCTCCLTVPTPGATFACLAETYLFAREGIREHSVGRPTAEFALHVERMAQRHGVVPRALNFAGQPPFSCTRNRLRNVTLSTVTT